MAMNMKTIHDLLTEAQIAAIDRVCPRRHDPPLPVPAYTPGAGTERVMLAVETFRRHMTDEGWQIQLGLQEAGYELWGRYLPNDCQDAGEVVCRRAPHTVVVQDKREWDPVKDGCFDKTVGFSRIEYIASRPDLFRLTIFKDSHQDAAYHQQAHLEMGAHAWIVYYHPAIVHHLAGWLRPEHLIRTYHSLDPAQVPTYRAEPRQGCLLSGAMGMPYYPFREAIFRNLHLLPQTTYLPHPGYGAFGTQTPRYLETLSQYKVAICTTSVFKYALRKLIEATACGCVVLTDLPAGEVMPEIDENLVRVPAESTPQQLADVIYGCIEGYDPDRQADFARRAVEYYDYRRLYTELAEKIETLRQSYVA
jgi:hypothetical protein